MTSSIAAQFTYQDRQVLKQLTSLSDFEKHVNQDRLANSEEIKETSLYFQGLLKKISTEQNDCTRLISVLLLNKKSQKYPVQYSPVRNVLAAAFVGSMLSVPFTLYFSSDWNARAFHGYSSFTIKQIWQSTVVTGVFTIISMQMMDKFLARPKLMRIARFFSVSAAFALLSGACELIGTKDEQLKQYRNIIAPIIAAIPVVSTLRAHWKLSRLDQVNNDLIKAVYTKGESLEFLREAITKLTPSTK